MRPVPAPWSTSPPLCRAAVVTSALTPARRLPQNIGVQDFPETRRNFAEFVRRTGTLPEQREGESVDFRSLLHRDGSVLSAITLADLKNPEVGRAGA